MPAADTEAYTWGIDDWDRRSDSSLADRRVASPVGGGVPSVRQVVDTGQVEYELSTRGRGLGARFHSR